MADQQAQSLKNHTRYDPAFHFVLLPLLLLHFIYRVYQLVRHFVVGDDAIGWTTHAGWVLIAFLLALLALKVRLYAVKLQDRLIRLEERTRLAMILPEATRARIPELTESQLVALRFASDGELADLAKSALDKKLSSKQIKEGIRNWRADNFSSLKVLRPTIGCDTIAPMLFVRFLVLVLSLGAVFAEAPTSWTPEFSMQFQTVSAVMPSPDGKLAVWVQTRPVIEAERSEQVSQIWTGAVDGSRRFQLTRSGKGASNPSWSADGKYIYFVSDRGGGAQVHRILLISGEAEKLTDFKGGVGSYALSPDGKSIAFTAYEAPADEEKSKKEKRDMHVVDANPANAALYVVVVDSASDSKHKHKRLFEAKYHVAGFDWSPDSRFIAFSHTPTQSENDWPKSDVSEVEVETGKLKDLAASAAAEHTPLYSPDGRYVALARSTDPPRWASDDRIVLLNRQTGQVRELPPTYDAQPNLIGWSADSTRILFSEAKRTRSSLSAMPIDGPPVPVYEPSQGILNSIRLNASRNFLGITWETPDRAPEAFVMQEGAHTPTQISRANTDLPKLPLGHTEVLKWKSKDGLDVEGLLTYPAGYEKGKRVPLILNIHGGPTGVFGENFIGRWGLYPIAVFAAKGYAVLRPNPRGSSGYGQKFRFANYGDWGGKDYEDDQAGVDAAIAMGVADPDRLAIMGWSYGGFMTSWTITQTKRYKAAVIGAGVTNLWSFTGTADIPGFIPDYFGGEAWDNFDAWRKHSPITYIKGVTTPTLLLHGEADDRVPVTQGYEYYNALKRQGTLAKMVVYPRTPHGPREPKFILDIMQRHVDWVEKYVR